MRFIAHPHPPPGNEAQNIRLSGLQPHYCYTIIFHNSNDMLSNHIQVKNQYTFVRKKSPFGDTSYLGIRSKAPQRIFFFLLLAVLAFVATHHSIQP